LSGTFLFLSGAKTADLTRLPPSAKAEEPDGNSVLLGISRLLSTAATALTQVNRTAVQPGMKRDLDHLREQAERARRWAAAIPDPMMREQLEIVARDYDAMIENMEHGPCMTELRDGSDN
jgi:hypothetical protein